MRKLRTYTELSPEDEATLSRIPHQRRWFQPHRPIGESGQQPAFITVLTEGMAARVKYLEDGRRQIVSLHVPGDVLDLHNLLFSVADHDTEAISRCEVALFPRAAFEAALTQSPSLARMFLFDSFVDAAIAREWTANIGRRTAYERMAHLICELAYRLYLIGQAKDGQFSLPVTQADLSDALGITAVHANRTLQLLRSERLIATKGKAVEILDWEGLVAASGFDPGYLHIEGLGGGIRLTRVQRRD